MTSRAIDQHSAARTKLRVTERADLLVVGIGPAIVAAVTAAEGDGAAIVLYDDDPIALVMVGDAVA